MLLAPDGRQAAPGKVDRALVQAVARAHCWKELLESGKARAACGLARHEQCRVSYVQRHLPLAYLSPALVEAIVEGRQPADCSLKALIEDVGLNWSMQGVGVA